MKSLIRLGALALTAVFVFSAAANAKPSNKWRLQFSGNAESAGIIVLKLAPKGLGPQEVSIPIEDGRSENGVAKDVTKSLQIQLSNEHYHVERDDGEDVLIKKRGDLPNFDIEILSNTVDGVRINPDRE